MPTEDLPPPPLRGLNKRIDEPAAMTTTLHPTLWPVLQQPGGLPRRGSSVVPTTGPGAIDRSRVGDLALVTATPTM